MTISATGSSPYPYTPQASNSANTIGSDFSALASALQGNNISGAQQALTQLEKDDPKIAQAIQNAGSNSPLASLASAIQSGNLSAAQSAFTQLQQARGHHHHHHGGGGAPAQSTPQPQAQAADSDGDNDGSGSSTGSNINATA